jgi:hypothetical protein
VKKSRCHVSLGQRRGRQNSDDRQQRGDSRVLAVANLNFHDLLYTIVYRPGLRGLRSAKDVTD